MRLVVGERGRVEFESELIIRFDYGVSIPWVRRLEDESGLSAVAGPDGLVLRSPAPLENEDMRTTSAFSVASGECVPFVLSYAPLLWTPAGASRRPAGSSGHGEILAAMALQLSIRRRLGRRGKTISVDAKGAELRADWRRRRGADDLSA